MASQSQPGDLTAADVLDALRNCSGDAAQIYYHPYLHLPIGIVECGNPGDVCLWLHDGESPGLTRQALIERLKSMSVSYQRAFAKPILVRVPVAGAATPPGAMWYFVERAGDIERNGATIATIFVRTVNT
jgi:hypothetical protein